MTRTAGITKTPDKNTRGLSAGLSRHYSNLELLDELVEWVDRLNSYIDDK